MRAVAFQPVESEAVAHWAPRLRAGGIATEAARDRNLRRSLPHLARWIENAGLWTSLPADERALLTAARLSAAACASRLRATLAPLGPACRAEGVVPLLLKGGALHGALYSDPADRPVSDADLYVAPAERAKMVRALDAAGFAPDRMTAARLVDLESTAGLASALSDLIFRRRDGTGVPVEVKLDPVQVGVPLRRPEAFVENATPSKTYDGFVVPAPEAMAVQQAIHLARHDGSDALWFAELAHGVAQAMGRFAFDVGRAQSIVAGEGLDAVVRTVFAAAESLFPGTIASGLRRGAGGGPVPTVLRASPHRPGRADERRATLSLQVHHALSSRRFGHALRSLATRFRPSDGYVAARMGLAPGTRVTSIDRARRLLRLFRGTGSP